MNTQESRVGNSETVEPDRQQTNRTECKHISGVQKVIAEYRKAYIQSLLMELESDPTLKAKVEAIKKDVLENKQVALETLLGLEYDYISRLDETALDAKLETAAESLRYVNGEQNPAWVTRGMAICHGQGSEGQKRQFLKNVFRELFNNYQSAITTEKLKWQLTSQISIAACVAAFLLLLAFSFTTRIIFLVLLCGLSGAYLSIKQRISALSIAREHTKHFIAFIYAPFGLYVSLAFGMIFPLIALLFITSGIIHSSIFPKLESIVELRKDYKSFKSDFEAAAHKEIVQHAAAIQSAATNNVNFVPSDDLDHLGNLGFDKYFAALLVICLVSGVSERMIMDAVDIASKRAFKNSERKPDR